ncbi:MAG: DUF2341 domain-containing protein [Candidatus Thorarchaeota archaeon]|nr:DUF2341 domain-containing protein [Candidatus Thorarchaeota archaeon]
MRFPTKIVIFLLFVSPILLSHSTVPTIVPTEETTLSSVQGWLSDWEVRKSHTIEGYAGAGINYPIKLTVHFGSGTDSESDMYCDTLCRSDFGDIRFTDDDGTTMLGYWMESSVSSDNAVFWVEIADNLNTNQDIYVYYGNSEATSASDGATTFLFFDDFESGTFDNWDYSGDWEISTTHKTEVAYGAYNAGSTVQSSRDLGHGMNQPDSFLISLDARTFDNFNTFPIGISADTGSCYPCTFGSTNVLYYDGSYHNWPQNSALAYNTWYTIQIGFDMSSGKLRGWKDGLYMGEVNFVSQASGETPTNVTAFRPGGGTQNTRHLALDNVYIRKWIPSEPSHGVWGSMESTTQTSPPTTTLPTNTTTTGPPPTFDIVLILTIGGGAVIIIALVLVCRARGPTSQGQSPYNW